MRLILVEDDPLLGEGLQTALRRSGYTVDWLRDGASALAAARAGGFDLLLLDLGLPALDGLRVIRAARQAGSEVPILVLTARDRIEDRVDALDAGADDFLGKPFDPSELQARIRALLRRRGGLTPVLLRHAGVSLDPARFEAQVDGRPIELPRREFALLRTLVEHAGRVVSHDRLQQSLYGWDEDVSSNAVEVHIHHLRRKLGAEMIRTVRGVGYALATPPA